MPAEYRPDSFDCDQVIVRPAWLFSEQSGVSAVLLQCNVSWEKKYSKCAWVSTKKFDGNMNSKKSNQHAKLTRKFL